jgi:hypothetical protein
MSMHPVERSGMRLLGQHDLGGHGNCGEGTALLQRAGKRYLYLAHESGPANFSVLDVTHPARPRLLAQTSVPHRDVRSNSLAVADDLLIVAYQVRTPGQRPAGIEIFDLGQPAEPRLIGSLDLSGPHSRGTHWVGFTGGRYAYLSTGTPDSRPTHVLDDQFPLIVDVSHPGRPAEAGRWWLPGTQASDGCPPPVRHQRFDAGFRAHNVNVFPARPDRAYIGYLDAGVVILDIAEVAAPRLVAQLDYHPPMPGFTHTVLPLFTRGLLAISDETVHDHAADYPKLLWFADASSEQTPLIISTAPMPPVAEYARRGGRFGAHNLHENEPFDWSWRSEDIVFGTFFNAGVRAFDVRDPFQPREVAAFVPPAPPASKAGAIQINDVYVAADGLVYAVDRGGGGLYILQFDGRPAS